MRTIEFPIEECMFAVLSAPNGRGGEARQELAYQFEALLPVPIDSVRMVFSKCYEGKVIACASETNRLEALRLEFERAIPESLPGWIHNAFPTSAREQLNLLTGPMKPARHLRREHTTAKAICFVSLALALLVVLGAERRMSSLDARVEQTGQQISDLYRAVLPPSAGTGGQPDAIQFAALMNQAAMTRSGAGVNPDQALVADLSAVLSNWPSTIQARVRSLICDRQGMRLEVTLLSNEAAGELLMTLGDIPGWEIQSHSMTPRAGLIELSLRLTKRAGTTKPGRESA